MARLEGIPAESAGGVRDAFSAVVPYLIGLFVLWKWGIGGLSADVPYWKVCLGFASVYSIGIAQLAVALIGGNAIAGERVDRSAEFQAYMPIPRRKILSAKLLLAMAMVAVIWLPNAAVLWGTLDALMRRGQCSQPRGRRPHLPNCLRGVWQHCRCGLTFFCVGWLFSS